MFSKGEFPFLVVRSGSSDIVYLVVSVKFNRLTFCLLKVGWTNVPSLIVKVKCYAVSFNLLRYRSDEILY